MHNLTGLTTLALADYDLAVCVDRYTLSRIDYSIERLLY
jgi:hypothetical protein